MKNAARQFADIKIDSLEIQLTGFWSGLSWNLRDCPLTSDPNAKGLLTLSFECSSPFLNTELRYACWQKFELKKWSLDSPVIVGQIRRVIRYLNHVFPRGRTLLERSLDEWMLSLRTYLVENGEYFETTGDWINGQQEVRTRSKGNRCLEIFRGIYKELQEAYDTRPLWQREVWDLRRMGASLNPSKSEHTLSFRGLAPDWLLAAAQKYMYLIVTTRSASSCASRISAIKKFGRFIEARHPQLHPSEVSRELLIEYLNYLAQANLKTAVRRDITIHLAVFFEHCARENWLPVPDKRLIYREDLPRLERRQPRFIPESVLAQLQEHLDQSTTGQFERMVLVLQECGMRISELCTLKLNCLSQDGEGDFFLTSYQRKLKKDHTIPISRETARLIQEQLQDNLASQKQSEYVFTARGGKAAKQDTFSKKLNEFAVKYDIRDENGKLWRFQPHQFRHSVGNRMVNNQVPQLFIQRFLGHESPEMTSTYAHIHDQTLKKEFESFIERRGKLIDVTGRAFERADPGDLSDSQWFKKNVLAQALPNGYCALPLVQSECPHANACLTCAHFRTDAGFLAQHESQLGETTKLVQIARHNKWTRQTEMNERVEKNLRKIIASLKVEEPADG